jgi:RHS repeat-associated protein
LLSGGEKVWRFTWNGLDQLTELVDPAGHRWSYAYDGLNRRVAKTHRDAAGSMVESWRFGWDGLVLVEQSHDVAGVVTSTTWEHDGFTPVAQTRSRSQSEFDAEFAAIVTDLVGAPVRVQDSVGRTVWTSQASTWGATDADAAMPLRFPGQYHDIESGLFYNLNRYYNPDTGRYVSSDPLGLAPSPNPHAYVPNPTTQIDPLGLHGVHVLTEKGLKHSFDRHAVQWFGGEPAKATHMAEWRDLIERTAKSKLTFSWSSGATDTVAHLARIEGKYFVTQFDATTGHLVTAFVPNNSQLSAMLKLLGKA